MQYPSPHSGLFSSSGADPRAYHGPPNLRRARTPALNASPIRSSTPSQGAADVSVERVSFRDYDDSLGLLVNTPRSLRACSKVGILPRELLRPSVKDTIAEMKIAKEDVNDKDIVLMRHGFRAQLQQRKLKAAIESYWSVCEEETLTPTKRQDHVVDSTKVMNEEKQLRKIVETNKSRLRQQLLRTQLLQKQRERENERLETQRQADIQKKEDMVKAMAERSKQEEEAAALRNQAREIEKAKMAAAAEAARRAYESQDEDLKVRMEERRLALDANNRAKRAENKARREKMKAQSEAAVAQRKMELEERMAAFEHEHQARMRQKEIEHARKRSEAEAREVKIQEAISRSNAQMQAKILMTEAKATLVEQRLHEFARERSAKRKDTLADEMEKEAKRQETYDQAVAVQNERVNAFIHRMSSNNERQEKLRYVRAKELSSDREMARQRMLFKQDAVERQKRVDEQKRTELLSSVDEKVHKIEEMKRSHQEMKVQRKLHREEADRTRVKLTQVTPGPSDYVVIDGDCGTVGPQWKMGLPASALGPRVVIKNQPTPGYDDSPGPAAYTAALDDSRHRARSAYSFTKAERFNDSDKN